MDREVTKSYAVSLASSGSDTTEKGTIVLARLGPCGTGAEIVVSGTIELHPDPDAGLFYVFVGR